MEVRKKLTEFESTMAILIGGGLTLIVMAFLLSAAQGSRANEGFFNAMFLIGIGLLVVGTVIWFLGARAWTKRDDWSEPLYVGHEHDHHDDHAADGHAAAHDDHGHPVVAVNPNPAGAPAAHAPAESAPVAPVAEHNAVIPAPPAEIAPVAPRAVVPAVAEVAEKPEHAADPNAAPLKAVAPESISALADEAPASPYTEGDPIAPEDAIIPAEAEATPTEAPANPYQTGERAAPPEAIVPAEVAAEAPTPAMPAARPDNLTLIEGIGPKIAAALVGAGVTTFARVAEMAPADLEAIVRSAGVRMVGKGESWPMQARLAADGKMAELQELQDKLKGGQLPTEG